MGYRVKHFSGEGLSKMGLLQIVKWLLLLFGGITGILTLLVGYILQMPLSKNPELEDLHPMIQKWHSEGSMFEVLGKKMFVVTKGSSEETIILIHGFPSSSFDYFDVIDTLSVSYRVVAFDHIGFGFSDKPINYTYSLIDQAEQAIALWQQLGIRRAHLVSHDMGDSVLTEILARHQRGALPEYFNTFFQTVTFTNGGMVYDLINKRLSQILLNSWMGQVFSSLSCRLDGTSFGEKFGRRQLGSVWSPSYQNEEKKKLDLANMDSINKYKNGKCLFHKTISYLTDRSRFEPRWLESLSKLELPIQILWGDSDAVAPMSIPQTLAKLINPQYLSFTTLPGAGHFLMLERPELWMDRVISFARKHSYQ